MPNSTVPFHLFTVQAYWGRGNNSWTVRADGNRKREILGRLGSSPCVSSPQMYNSEICPGRNYLDVVHIFQQLRKGVDLHQGDNLSDGGCLRLSRLIYHRTQCRQFKVAMFLRKKWQGNKSVQISAIICLLSWTYFICSHHSKQYTVHLMA